MEEENIRSCLQKKKLEANRKKWLYLDIDAASLLRDCTLSKEACEACCRVMIEEMLEGDRFLRKPKRKDAVSLRLCIRYYVDNLRMDRKKADNAGLLRHRF